MRARLGLTLSCFCLALASPALALATPAISLTFGSEATPVGDPFELHIDINRSYANPFDSDEISVDAIIVRPSGAVDKQPAFFTKDVVRALDGSHEILSTLGLGHFALRYAPSEPGAHQVTILARDDTGVGSSSTITFYARPSSHPGFIRVDPKDPFSLAFDDSSAFVPFGANVAWSRDPLGGFDIAAYYKSLESAGSTWTRLWLTHFGEGFSLEWNAKHPSGYYPGLGRYSLELAYRLDLIFEEAQKRHIFLQLALWQHSQFETDLWSSWKENPFNAANGGPAKSSADFFENKQVAALNRRLLRYLVARYSAYRSLLAWEIMNEMDGVHAPFDSIAAWSEARARDLRSLDPNRHLVTTSLIAKPASSRHEVFRSTAYDLAQVHAYDPHFDSLLPHDAELMRAYGKPTILAEFGIDPEGILEAKYPRGQQLRQASFIAFASGFQGGAMPWWWDDYLRPNQLWSTQSPLTLINSAVDLRGMHDSVDSHASAYDSAKLPLEVFGRLSNSAALFYLRHPSARWDSTASLSTTVEGATITFDIAKNSRIQALAFDPQSGALLSDFFLRSDPGGKALAVLPSFNGELLICARAVAEDPEKPDVQVGGGCSLGPSPANRLWINGLLLVMCLTILQRRRRSS